MKLYRNIYKLSSFIFTILTIIEIIIYLLNETNYYGLYYILISLLIIIILNIKVNKKTKLNKSLFILVLQIFNSYFLFNILIKSYKYIDYSSKYISNIFVTSKIIKPILVTILVLTSFLNLYKINITNYKINKHNK